MHTETLGRSPSARVKSNKSRRFSGTWMAVSSLLRKNSMCEGRRSQIVLLDERRLDLIIQPKLYAGELLDLVASHFHIKEKEYFGIAYYPSDTNQFSWLQLDKRVLEHDLPKKNPTSAHGSTPPLTLYFRVKYYVESITQLGDSATVEAFYLQAKSLLAKGEIEGDSETVFQLAALVLQATYGDFLDESVFRSHLRRLPILPASTLKENPSITQCEERVLHYYKNLAGQPRGAAIVNYLTIIESLPTYGQHYYEIKDKTNTSCWLGLSYKGISQYDKNDRRNPKRVFLWKQLENLYYRDRKFTIEVHEARRVVHTLSSFNLYEDAIEEPVEDYDDLSDAICDPTTQVSVSRRTLAPANVTVYVWYASSAVVAKCIWSMAIAQHHFFLDRKHRKSQSSVVPTLSQIASELCRSVQSLSSVGSHSNISRSTSTSSLPSTILGGEISEESKAATIEMLAALRARKEALEEALNKKTEELKSLCLKEGELTGEIPAELPLQPGESKPQIRRRVGTSFSLSDKVICKVKNKERETLSDLELEYEIQSKIASAAFQLANDCTARKSVRKQRKISYIRATDKLRSIEQKIYALRRERKKASEEKEEKPSEGSDEVDSVGQKDETDANSTHGTHESSISSQSDDNSTVKSGSNGGSVPPCSSLPQLTVTPCEQQSPEPRKEKCPRQRHQSLQHLPYSSADEGPGTPYEPCSWSISSSTYSPNEFDSVSCNSATLRPPKVPYRNRFEARLDIEGSNLYSVPNRRASQIFDSQDDLLLNGKRNELEGRSPSAKIPVGRSDCAEPAFPLSSSYDEHSWYSRSKTLEPLAGNCSSVETSFVGCSSDVSSLNCFENYHSKNLPSESPRNSPKLLHFHSENSLHNEDLTYASHRLEGTHISEPDLADPLQGKKVVHVQSVPHLHEPVKVTREHKKLVGSNSCSSSSVKQVVDLVNASMLLQDGKRSTSAGYSPAKVKTKEWIETSLDSPLPSRKQKPKPPVYENHPLPTVGQESRGGGGYTDRPGQLKSEQYRTGSPDMYSEANKPRVFPYTVAASSAGSPAYSVNSMGAADTVLKQQTAVDMNHIASTCDTYSYPVDGEMHVQYNESSCDAFTYHKNSPCEHGMQMNQESLHEYPHYINLTNDSSVNASCTPNACCQGPCRLLDSCMHERQAPEGLDAQQMLYEADSSHRYHHHHHHHHHHHYPSDCMASHMHMVQAPHTHPCDVQNCSAHAHLDTGVLCAQVPCAPSSACGQNQVPCSSALPDHVETHPANGVNNFAPFCHYSTETVVSVPQETALPLPSCDATSFPFPGSVEVNVVTVGHFQPYWEETKPYELSDFYKYSTKHRRPQPKPGATESNSSQPANQQRITENVLAGKTQVETKVPSHIPENSGNVFVSMHSELTAKYAQSPPELNHNVTVNAHVAFVNSHDGDDRDNHHDRGKDLKANPVSPPMSGDENGSFGEILVPVSLADAFQKEMFAWYDNREPVKKATLV